MNPHGVRLNQKLRKLGKTKTTSSDRKGLWWPSLLKLSYCWPSSISATTKNHKSGLPLR